MLTKYTEHNTISKHCNEQVHDTCNDNLGYNGIKKNRFRTFLLSMKVIDQIFCEDFFFIKKKNWKYMKQAILN